MNVFPKTQTKQLNIRISPQLLARLNTEATKRQTTASQLVRLMIEKTLKRKG